MGEFSKNRRKPKRNGEKIKVGQVAALPEGRGATVELKNGNEIALFNVAGKFHAGATDGGHDSTGRLSSAGAGGP